jgi:hypothetical protein
MEVDGMLQAVEGHEDGDEKAKNTAADGIKVHAERNVDDSGAL